jgi:hypothetical protein
MLYIKLTNWVEGKGGGGGGGKSLPTPCRGPLFHELFHLGLIRYTLFSMVLFIIGEHGEDGQVTCVFMHPPQKQNNGYKRDLQRRAL